jgi:hypothetical protein
MRRLVLTAALSLLAAACIAVASDASANHRTCSTTGGSAGISDVEVAMECGSHPKKPSGIQQVDADPDILDIDYVPSCQEFEINTTNGITCNVKIPGCDPNETKNDVRVKYAKGSDENPSGGWVTDGWICIGPGGPPLDPTVGPGDVLRALHRTGLPDAELQTEPGFKSGKTLVNFDTNFYTKAHRVHDTFILLGQDVEVIATPTSYTWHFDSGQPDQTRTTTTPGAPYPELDITYAYDNAHVTVHPSVDVTYSARFSVNGGPWQRIPATVTIEGDPINRYVAEATAVLADMN